MAAAGAARRIGAFHREAPGSITVAELRELAADALAAADEMDQLARRAR